jgi:hypothetical protein
MRLGFHMIPPPDPTMTDRAIDRLAILMIAAAAAVAVITYWFSAFTIVDQDPFMMGEIARRVLDGEALYRDAWDTKPPLALLFYAPAQAVAPMSYLGQQLFGALWTALQAGLAFALLAGETVLVRAIAASLVLLLPLSRTDFVWASSEDAVNLFTLALTLIAYRIARRGAWHARELAAAGALAVFAFHCRQPGVLFAIPVGALILLGPQRGQEKIHGLVALAGGAIAGLALVLAIVLSVTDFSSYVDAVFVVAERHVGAQLEGATWVASEQVLLLRHHPYIPMALFALMLASGRRERLLMAGIGVVSILVVLAPLREYGHYQEQLIPLLVLSGVIAVRVLDGLSRRVAFAYGTALVVFFMLNATATAQLLRRDEGQIAQLESVVDVIEAENAKASGSVLALGRHSAYVYFRTRVAPVHKFHFQYFLDDLSVLPQPPAEVVREILERPPTWLVVDAPTLARHRDAPPETPSGQLVHGLCGTRVCEEIARTANWHVFRVR